jgi:hypothetical protein
MGSLTSNYKINLFSTLILQVSISLSLAIKEIDSGELENSISDGKKRMKQSQSVKANQLR